MKRVYDMSTLSVIDQSQSCEHLAQVSLNDAIAVPQLQLQPLTSTPQEAQKIPPELVLADLNAFLTRIS